MSGLDCTISLADLSDAGLQPHLPQAVAIAREVMRRADAGELPGIPSAHVLRFSADGTIGAEGPVAAERSVERAARLLEAMLPGPDAPSDLRVPGALRLVLGRATRSLDLPPYASIAEFGEALRRFSAPDAAHAVSELYAAWSASQARATPEVEDRALTISDVRRARRSTGLTLADVSRRSRIPVSLLRELEWGYFVNWPAGPYGRSQLVRYARASGIDEQVVIDAVWPVLQEAIRAREAQLAVVDASIVEEEPDAPRDLMRIVSALPSARPRHSAWRRRVALTLAIPALIAIGLIPAMWQPARQASPEPATVPAAVRTDPPDRSSMPAPDRASPAREGPAPSRTSRTAFAPALATSGSASFDQSARPGAAILRSSAASGNTIRITRVADDGAKNFHARPSPDGRYIAFDSDREGERAVYVAEADGRNVRRVSGEGFAAIPSWAPDGRRLAFVKGEPSDPDVWNLWTADIESGETTRLTSHRSGQPWGAAWLPDGDRLAYSHGDRLIVLRMDGSVEQTYRSPVPGRKLLDPAVSPDGRHVVFQLYKEGAWLLDLEDSSTRRILTDPTVEGFAWAPDGRRVAYHSRKTGDWGVWIMASR